VPHPYFSTQQSQCDRGNHPTVPETANFSRLSKDRIEPDEACHTSSAVSYAPLIPSTSVRPLSRFARLSARSFERFSSFQRTVGNSLAPNRNLYLWPERDQHIRVRPHSSVIQIRHPGSLKTNNKSVRHRLRQRDRLPALPMVVIDIETGILESAGQHSFAVLYTRFPLVMRCARLSLVRPIKIGSREKRTRFGMGRACAVVVYIKGFGVWPKSHF
jgi:hypothetical protein